MSALKTKLDLETIESLGVYNAAVLDGYWDYKARDEIQYVFLLGQLQATESMHLSFGNNSTRGRIKLLKSELEKLDVRLEHTDDTA